MSLYQRLIVAALSGVLVGFHWANPFLVADDSKVLDYLIEWIIWSMGGSEFSTPVLEWIIWSIGGSIFSLAVMVPFLSARSIHWLRILALMGVGSLSYGFASGTFAELHQFSLPTDTPVTRSYLEIYSFRYAYEIAGLVGALIVGTGGVLLLRMKIQWRFVLSIIIAGVLGGIVFDLTGGAWVQLTSDSVISHAAWQTLVCAALCVAKIDTR